MNSAMKDKHFTNSTLRERIVEHVFVGDLLRTLWINGSIDVEILRPEFDAHGYDLVLCRGKIVRHIQLKTQAKGNVSVCRALAEKPSGCVIRIGLNEITLDMESFFWFGGVPGNPLPDLSPYPHPRRATHNSKGERPIRLNHHLVPTAVFIKLQSMKEVIAKLFGDITQSAV
jgi:hypothetical protein